MDERDTDLVTNLKLQRKVAVFFILAERIWESSTALFCTVLLFVACTLSGLWEVLDPVLHLMALAGFLVALLFSVRHFRDQFHFPEQAEADARLERESNLSHRPVRSMAAVPKWLHDDNARSRYFWKLHQDQHHKKLGHVKYFLPKFGLSSSDKYSLRSLVILLLLSGYVVGGTAPFSHFRTAFKPHLGGEEISLAMDIWAAPPEYTGRAPQLIHQLTGEESRDLQAAEQGIKKFTLPEGAKLIGRVSGGGKDIPAFFVGDEQFPFEVIEGENFQIEVNEIGAGRWTLEKGGDTLISWDFEIIPDLPPIIKMLTLPAVTDRSALNIIALAEDDYGILDLKAQISKPDQPEILEIPLPFPSGSPVVESKSYHDLTAHRWAGLVTDLWVVGRDIKGQAGKSKKVRITLPEREFRNPIARALVHERKQLFIDADKNRFDVVGALGVILSLPEAMTGDFGAALMVSVARSELLFRSGANSIEEVTELLWQAALKYENGNLTLAEEALREAEKRLMDALNSGATDEEIRRLVEELKQAMDEFLAELARNQPENQPNTGEGEALRAQDLDNLLSQIDEFARSGARDEARNLLSQLQDILENLQSAGMTPTQNGQTAQKMLDALEKLAGDQQKLLDETMRSVQQNGYLQRSDDEAQSGSLGELAKQQEALRQMLGHIMGEMGLEGKIPGALGRAERAMNDAREQLQLGDGDAAQASQQEVLQQLQQGMEGIAQAQGTGASGQFGSNGNRDPLGRQSGSDGGRTDPNSNINIFGKPGLSATRAVLDELRRRLADPNRPELEKKYLKRLLERF